MSHCLVLVLLRLMLLSVAVSLGLVKLYGELMYRVVSCFHTELAAISFAHNNIAGLSIFQLSQVTLGDMSKL